MDRTADGPGGSVSVERPHGSGASRRIRDAAPVDPREAAGRARSPAGRLAGRL